jgi:hypothetical protein
MVFLGLSKLSYLLDILELVRNTTAGNGSQNETRELKGRLSHTRACSNVPWLNITSRAPRCSVDAF